MANTLRFKRGLASGIPTALAGEPLFTTDTFDLYIGNGTTNTRFQKYIASGTTSQILRGDGSLYTFPLAISSPSTGQVLKYNGTSWVNDSDAGITGSGTTNYLSKFTGATTLGNSGVFETSAGNVGIGTISPLSATGYTTLAVNNTTGGNIDLMTGGVRVASWNNTSTETYFGTRTNTPLAITTNATEVARFFNNGNFRLGGIASDAGFRLDVNGTTRLNGVTSVLGTSTSAYITTIRQTNTTSDVSFGLLVTAGTTVNDVAFRVQNAAQNTNFFTVLGNGESNFSNSVGIGTTSLTGITLNVSKNITGSTSTTGINSGGTILSDVTGTAHMFLSFPSTQAATFTLTNLFHFRAFYNTLGANSTITNQYGFHADASLTSATNNYGFYGNIAAATGRWNLYMNGTANNYMAGSLGIGQTTLTGSNLRISKAHTGSASAINFYIDSTIQSDVTNSPKVIATTLSTQAASFTVARATHYLANQGTIGAGSAITTQVGFEVDNTLIGATINYGFFGNIASGTNRWNLYMNGTALNYLNGNTLIGSTTDSGEKLQVTGTMKVTGALVGGDIISAATDFRLNNNAFSRIAKIDAGGGFAGGYNVEYTSTTVSHNSTGAIAGYRYASNGNMFFFTNTSQAAGTTATARMTLDNAGNLGLGVTPSAWDSTYRVYEAPGNAFFAGFSGQVQIGQNGYYSGAWKYKTTAVASKYYQVSGTHVWQTAASGTADTNITYTQAMTLDANGNLGIAVTNPSEKLQIAGNILLVSGYNLYGNSTSGNYSRIELYNASTGNMTLGTYFATASMLFLTNGSERMRINAAGNLLIGSTADSGERLQVTGTAKISGEFRVAAAINSTQATFANTTGRGLAISTAVVGGTNEAAVVLNARSSVTSGTFIFQTDGTQRVQIDSTGLIINGGNALEFINSAANAVSAIRPTSGGTSVMSTNSNGLHIAVGTEAAGDLILASNNTERVRLSSNGWFSHTSATNPSSSVTDSYVQYSADVTAGNAAPHFRTENGAVIKLYQETTAVGNSIISLGGGSAVLDDTTFDGYTLRQIVKALRNQGILA